MLDTFVHMFCEPKIAFIAKAEARNYPGLGGVAAGMGCLFISRDKSKEGTVRITE